MRSDVDAASVAAAPSLVRHELNPAEHQRRHKDLHRAFDELLADWLAHNPRSSSIHDPILSLMEWSHRQTLKPERMATSDGAARAGCGIK